MEVILSEHEWQAVNATRRTLSPGGAASRMGVSRKTIIDRYRGEGAPGTELLAWKVKATDSRYFGKGTAYRVYVDFGCRFSEEPNPYEWRGRDLGLIVRDALLYYSRFLSVLAEEAG